MKKKSILKDVTERLISGTKAWLHSNADNDIKPSKFDELIPIYTHSKEWLKRHQELETNSRFGHRLTLLLIGGPKDEATLFLRDVLMNDYAKDPSYPRAQEIWLYCRTHNILVPEEIDREIAVRFAREYDDWAKPGKKNTWMNGVTKDGYDIFFAVIREKHRHAPPLSDGDAIETVYARLNDKAKIEKESDESFEKKARRVLNIFRSQRFQISLTGNKVIDFARRGNKKVENYFSRMTGGDDLGYGL